MNGLRFELGCPECGGPLHVLAAGTPETRRTVTTVACTDCLAEQLVTVTLEQIRRPRTAGIRKAY